METNPIIFGDFMKMGADAADRMYEDLTDMNKLKNVLNDVRLWICFAFEFISFVYLLCLRISYNP